MTNITLRKAAALQDLVREAIASTRPAVAVQVTIFGHLPADIAKEKESAEALLERHVALNRALMDIRQATAKANVGFGVSDLLAEQASVTALIDVIGTLAESKPFEGDDIASKRAKRMVEREEAQPAFGRSVTPEVITVNLFDEDDIAKHKQELLRLKRRRIEIRDELAEINAATRIVLSVETIGTLTAESLL